MLAAASDLPNRRPVWQALSNIFLDTDVSADRAWRIEVLSNSPYSVEELQHILLDEVYPILKYNLISVAGVWDGFDQIWLEEQILGRQSSPLRFLHRLGVGRLIAPRLNEWRATKAGIEATRGNHQHPQ